MPDGKRLWRTEKGDLVEDGHSEAQRLAYGVDDPLAAEDKGNVRKDHTPKAEAPVTPKKQASATQKK